ncbi:kinase-like protein [Colletotrichum somersetense]|nr:kinase-like protein [Colletotrichum somersetense]
MVSAPSYETSSYETPSYESICSLIDDELLSSLERQDSPDKRFARKDTAKQVLEAHKLKQFFRGLTATDDYTRVGFDINADEFAKGVQEKKLHDFLAVIISGRCSIGAARAFTKKLVEGDPAGYFDENTRDDRFPRFLPVDRPLLGTIFDDDRSSIERFYNTQARFTTLRIGKTGTGSKHAINTDVCRFPYVSDEEPIGRGAFGKVYKVRIARGHLAALDDSAEGDHVVARKDFDTDTAEKAFKEEFEILKDIMKSNARNDNIVEVLGTIECSKPLSYSILMPHAQRDMDKLLQTIIPDPLDDKARSKILQSAWGVAEGLEHLHKKLYYVVDGQRKTCFHLDLKPSNILIFQDSRGDEIWKISDFGLSKIKIQKAHTKTASASATRNQRGMGSYLPPEAESPAKGMDAKSDIWSLGGIVSMLFSYMEGGSDEVQSYKNNLGRDPKIADTFYKQVGLGGHKVEVDPEVKKQHERLIDSAKKRSRNERDSIQTMLKFLEKRVFQIDKAKRCDSTTLANELNGIMRYYQQSQDLTNETRSHVAELRTHIPNRLGSFFKSRPPYSQSSNVQQWTLDIEEPVDFTGCATSPDCSIITYWTDATLYVFKGELLQRGSTNVLDYRDDTSSVKSFGRRARDQSGTRGSTHPTLTLVGEFSTSGKGYSWKAVTLSNRYLVAATTAENFMCYVFDIEMAPDLSKFTPVSKKELPTVHTLAITSDHRSLVSVLSYGGNNNGVIVRQTILQSGPPNSPIGQSFNSSNDGFSQDALVSLREEIKTFPVSSNIFHWSQKKLRNGL